MAKARKMDIFFAKGWSEAKKVKLSAQKSQKWRESEQISQKVFNKMKNY
jgi:hypothetical protein